MKERRIKVPKDTPRRRHPLTNRIMCAKEKCPTVLRDPEYDLHCDVHRVRKLQGDYYVEYDKRQHNKRRR